MPNNDFKAVLLQWYSLYHRHLPWRETRDPYRIWVSEIILQQTRVEQGLGYYRRFIERFPDMASLAMASEDEVLRMWQGLGYYSRGRNLLAAAKNAGGIFPTTYEGVRAMKGVGDYTAAAVCSIAYGMPYAVVDGNVYRVLARFFGISTPIDSPAGKREFASLAKKLLDRNNPGIYNQALMDFGAIQCVPRSPDCNACPLQGGCAAFTNGRIDELPVKKKAAAKQVRHLNYLIATAGDMTFIRKRSAGDIWQGLYEFPMIETSVSVDYADTLMQLPEFRQLFPPESSKILSIELQQSGVRHILTHRILIANFFRIVLSPTTEISGYLRVPIADLPSYPFPRLLLNRLGQRHRDVASQPHQKAT